MSPEEKKFQEDLFTFLLGALLFCLIVGTYGAIIAIIINWFR